MKIKINGEFVDFFLEQEKTLDQLVSAIQIEISKNNQQIISIEIDGKLINAENTTEYLISDINLVEFIAVSTQQLFIDSIIEISNYLFRITNFLKGKTPSLIQLEERKNLSEGLDWLSDMCNILIRNIPDVERIVFSDEASKEFALLTANFKSIDESIEKFNSFIDYLNKLRVRFEDLLIQIKESNLTDTELLSRMSKFIELIPTMKELLSQVSALMHRGKDGDAFQLVEQVVQELKNYLHLIPVLSQSGISQSMPLSNGSTWSDVNQLLNDNLGMLVDAMETNDSVTIGDICDYELPENLDLITEAVKSYRSQSN